MKFFLDIDGVMVHANPHKPVELEDDGFYKFNKKAVEIFNSIFCTTKDELILSTSHRYKYSIAEWKVIFKKRGISSRKISIVENLGEHTHKVSRRVEIESWINHNHFDFEDLVILDDDKSLNELPSSLKKRLCLTNSYTGLNDVEDLKQIVNRKPKVNVNIESKYYKHRR
ncbi:HAD domain-containing protein [Pedobacter sp. GR22-6]|uniref:HAD domain-containing protein n=1 Tax=Pedobacter sp. GR22-6 TaxID=3127957 RepID=UPI00307D42B8